MIKRHLGALKPETILPLFEESERTIAAQNELTSFGAHRKNVGKIVDSHEYISDDKLHLSEGIIPRHMQGSVQSHDLDPIWGNLRSQTTKVWQPDGTRTELQCAPDSNTIIGRQFAPANPENRAGNNIMDRRRELKPSRLSECIVPKIFSTDFISLKSGADFGAFRPTKMETVGGLGMSFDDEKLCKLVIPYQTAASLR
uniref:Uncharacterized protein n=1 Tax=Meloidogyne javanica TaxID=6303 RepID=A0A915LIK6_MELJA